MENACCFTGHRPSKLPNYGDEGSLEIINLKQRLRTEIIKQIEKGIRVFICGMAMGVDIWCAEIVAQIKNNRPELGLTLIAAVPHQNQTIRWPNGWKQRYKTVMESVDVVNIMCPKYIFGCMQMRNQFMIDNSNVCIAVYDGSPGGTEYTIKIAEKAGKEVIVIDPFEQ